MRVEIRRLREWETARSVGGELWVDGQFECFTLEPSRLTPVHEGHPCIPAGNYQVVLSLSPHMHYVTPEVLQVPGRTAIRWHIANRPEELLGCVALGEAHQTDFVLSSKRAFTDLMALLKTATHGIEVTYIDPSEADPKLSPGSGGG